MKIILTKLLLEFFLIQILFIGCVKFDETNVLDSREEVEDCVGVECSAEVRAAKLGVVKQSQIFIAFRDGLGLNTSQISAETKTLFQEIRTNISSEGDVGGYSAPMSLSISQMAGTFCQDLINFEATLTEPVRLKGFDLSVGGTGASDPSQLKPIINSLARATWGRIPKEGTVDFIATQFQESSLAGVMGRPGALFVCTLTLSSPLIAFY